MGGLYQQQDLSAFTKQFASLEVRVNVEEQIIENIIATLKTEVKEETPKHVLVLECLRSLRNVVAGVKTNQKTVATFHGSGITILDLCDIEEKV